MKNHTLSEGGFHDNNANNDLDAYFHRIKQVPHLPIPAKTKQDSSKFLEERSSRECSFSSLDCTDTYHRTHAHYKSNHKIINSGDVIEVYEYQYPVYLGNDTTKRTNTRKNKEDRKEEYKARRGTRALNNIRRVALLNFSSKDKFLTLTFAENIKDINLANRELDKFLKKLRRRHKELKYILAVQFQKRGAVHYHLLINLPYVEQRELAELWGNGFVDIRKLNNVDNVGAYISRYIIKDAKDERLKGKKSYSTSKGLKRSKHEYLTPYGFEKFKKEKELNKHTLVYSSAYKTKWNGIVQYTEYNLKRHLNSQQRER